MNVLPPFGRGCPSLAHLPWNPMFVRPRRSAAVGARTAGTGGAGRAGAGSLRGCRRLASGTLFSQLKSDIRLHEFCIGESVETKHHAAGSSMATCTPKLRLFVDFAKKIELRQQRFNSASTRRAKYGSALGFLHPKRNKSYQQFDLYIIPGYRRLLCFPQGEGICFFLK